MTHEQLHAAVQRVLGRPVLDLSRRPWPYESTFPMEELSVILHGDARRSMLFKDLSEAQPPGAAAAAKPPFLMDSTREIRTYLDVLGPAGIEAPACYGAEVDAESGRAWLFLELIEGRPLWQVGEMEAWEEAARWVAHLHRRPLTRASLRLLRYDSAYLGSWLQRALTFAAPESLERIAASYERVVDRLASWPVSFLHGEFYPSNILIERGGGRFGIRPIDWEMAGRGPGLLDLAALTSGTWSEDERERLALAYFEASSPDVRRCGWSGFLDALEHCRLHLAVQWLGWSPEWSPPAEHAHDWLGEASRSAERLGF